VKPKALIIFSIFIIVTFSVLTCTLPRTPFVFDLEDYDDVPADVTPEEIQTNLKIDASNDKIILIISDAASEPQWNGNDSTWDFLPNLGGRTYDPTQTTSATTYQGFYIKTGTSSNGLIADGNLLVAFPDHDSEWSSSIPMSIYGKSNGHLVWYLEIDKQALIDEGYDANTRFKWSFTFGPLNGVFGVAPYWDPIDAWNYCAKLLADNSADALP
jgi:hypothetical protein